MKSILTVRGKTLNYKPQQIWFTGIHLCTSEFRSFTVLISNAHPYHEYCLHQAYLPFLPRTSVLIKEDCGRKLCQLVLQLLSLTSPWHYWPRFFHIFQHLSPCISTSRTLFSARDYFPHSRNAVFWEPNLNSLGIEV